MPLLRGRIFETGRSEGASEKGPSSRVPVHVLPASIQAGKISILNHITGPLWDIMVHYGNTGVGFSWPKKWHEKWHENPHESPI